MLALRRTATVAAALLAVAVAGCGVGAGERDEGEVELTVTRDHGAERMLEATASDPAESDSVVRLLDGEAEIETSYGGNFVDAIDGVSSAVSEGRSSDWFFYVNGYWSPVGAGEAEVRAGDRIWWDYRDWTDAQKVSAVVGSYPEPFVDGYGGEAVPTDVACFDAPEACQQVAVQLTDDGAAEVRVVEPEVGKPGPDALRVLVGPWEAVRSDPIARTLERGPALSGVYARPERCGRGWALGVLDDRLERGALLTDAGWVAATQRGSEQPTWVVSASEAEWLPDAIELLEGESLADHYAIATQGGEQYRLPGEREEPGDSGGGGC